MNIFPIWFASFSAKFLSALLQDTKLSGLWKMMFLKRSCFKKVDHVEEEKEKGLLTKGTSLMDMPDLAIEAILMRLPLSSLREMSAVCKDMRSRCQSDHLWRPFVNEKWGQIAGDKAYLEWKRSIALRQEICTMMQRSSRFWRRACLWPFSWLNIPRGQKKKSNTKPRMDSLMVWYVVLRRGHFWFPAQVYNREHGHVGFMLSCYDAELCYDHMTDTFRARYPPHGPRAVVIEEGISWHRLRAPPVDTGAHDVYISEGLLELRPGDHVEVQWRRNKEFPFGWWYGVVGHVDTCDKDNRHCHCHLHRTVWLEFNQYTVGSRWRRAAINRKSHHETGNDSGGFYGGVRKLKTKAETLIWERFWPSNVLE